MTPIYLASGVVSSIFKNPSQATKLKSKFMRTQEGYAPVFLQRSRSKSGRSSLTSISLWTRGYRISHHLSSGGEPFIRNWRPLVALLVVARRMKTFAYSTGQLLEMKNTGEVTAGEVQEVWNLIAQVNSKYDWNGRVKRSFVQACCATKRENTGAARNR